MSQLNIFRKFALLTGAFFLYTSTFGQSMLELLPGSKELVYDEKEGAHKLLGGANFIYQRNTMYSDSAYFYDKTKILKAYGNVHIQKDGTVNLFCDSLQYDGNTGKSKMWGHVRAIDTDYKLTTDSMDYDTRAEQGVYRRGGKIENLLNAEVLTSRVGYFYPKAKNFFFRGDVKYKSPTVTMTTDTLQYKYSEKRCYFFGPTNVTSEDAIIYCEKGWYNTETEEGKLMENATINQGSKFIEGDTILYDPASKISQGYCNVYYIDTTDKIGFKGDYALLNDSMNYSLVTGNAMAIKYQPKDTIYMRADVLFNENDSLGDRILTKGYHNVKIFGNNLQSVADSMVFVKENEYLELFKDPIVWSKNGELKGDSLRIYMNDSIIHRIEVHRRATVVMEVDSGLYYNQIGGNDITAYFKDNEIYQAIAVGNAQTIFYPTDEEKTDTLVTIKRLGMNRLYSSELKVYLDSGEVTGVTYFQQPDGVFYPMDKIKLEESKIANFALKFALRPKSVDDLYE